MQVGANRSSKHEKKRQAALHEQIMFHVQGSMQEVGVVATRVLMWQNYIDCKYLQLNEPLKAHLIIKSTCDKD